MVDFNYNFNLENFGLGVGAGWLSAYAGYQARKALGMAIGGLRSQSADAHEFARRSADARYLRDLAAFCEVNHLAGDLINLSETLVEPRFIIQPELTAPIDDEVRHDVLRVIPQTHDIPSLYAPYNIETLSISELDNGDRSLALLGLPGSGRTTALQAIALWSLGIVRFEAPDDPVDRLIEADDAAADDQKRSDRQKERDRIYQMALDRLRRDHQEASDAPANAQYQTTLFKQLTPMYVHVGNIRPGSNEFGRSIDPAEPLVRAIQLYCTRITSKTLPRNTYERLNEGKALVLIDGFDDLPPEDQPAILDWLRAFKETYGENFIIVAGPASGYGGLTAAGYTAVFLRPFNDVQISELASVWRANWDRVRKRLGKQAGSPDDRTYERVSGRSRGETPFELTAKIMSMYADPNQTDMEEWIRNIISRRLGGDSLGVVLPTLTAAARVQLERGFITAEGVTSYLTGGPIPTVPVRDTSETADSIFGDAIDDVEDLDEVDVEDNDVFADFSSTQGADSAGDDQGAADEPETPSGDGKETAKLIAGLHRAGLLTYFRGGRYQFRHPLLAAYLASLTFESLSADEQLDAAQDPRWATVMPFAAAHTSLDDVVQSILDTPEHSLLQNHLLAAARWLATADRGVGWRGALLRELGNRFVAPTQYAHARERIAAALISARDKGAVRIFEAGLRHPNADVRRLACLGLGALREPSAVPGLSELLTDSVDDVKLAAALALGAVGDDSALEEMVHALTQGEENLRQAIAEAFAAIPDEGYPVLYDAINHEDMMLRRAAVFGLRRINTPWALSALYVASFEDSQWYVRSAAEGAFANMDYGDTARGPQQFPEASDIGWLKEWIERLDDDAKRNVQNPDQFLKQALEEGDPETQVLAISNIGEMGHIQEIGLLYTALRHRDYGVRDAAYRSLARLENQIGEALPPV